MSFRTLVSERRPFHCASRAEESAPLLFDPSHRQIRTMSLTFTLYSPILLVVLCSPMALDLRRELLFGFAELCSVADWPHQNELDELDEHAKNDKFIV